MISEVRSCQEINGSLATRGWKLKLHLNSPRIVGIIGGTRRPLLLNVLSGFKINDHSPDSGPDYSLDHNWDHSLGDKRGRSWHHTLEHRPARKILLLRWQIKISTSGLKYWSPGPGQGLLDHNLDHRPEHRRGRIQVHRAAEKDRII